MNVGIVPITGPGPSLKLSGEAFFFLRPRAPDPDNIRVQIDSEKFVRRYPRLVRVGGIGPARPRGCGGGGGGGGPEPSRTSRIAGFLRRGGKNIFPWASRVPREVVAWDRGRREGLTSPPNMEFAPCFVNQRRFIAFANELRPKKPLGQPARARCCRRRSSMAAGSPVSAYIFRCEPGAHREKGRFVILPRWPFPAIPTFPFTTRHHPLLAAPAAGGRSVQRRAEEGPTQTLPASTGPSTKNKTYRPTLPSLERPRNAVKLAARCPRTLWNIGRLG